MNKFMIQDNEKILGIDWGAARIGLALGDSEIGLATPFGVVSDLKAVIAILKKEKIERIVIGKPIKMSGSEDQMTSGFLKFVEKLKKQTSLQLQMIDERLSSKAADALSGDKKTKAPRDAVAAMLILQTYFDTQRK